jgi:hypothetical protein
MTHHFAVPTLTRAGEADASTVLEPTRRPTAGLLPLGALRFAAGAVLGQSTTPTAEVDADRHAFGDHS